MLNIKCLGPEQARGHCTAISVLEYLFPHPPSDPNLLKCYKGGSLLRDTVIVLVLGEHGEEGLEGFLLCVPCTD